MSDKVTKQFKTTHKKFGTIEQTVEFDFTDVSRDELIDIAISHLKVEPVQRLVRAVKERGELKEHQSYTLSVRHWLDNKRQPRSTAEKVRSDLQKLTADERAALLAELQQQ